MSKRRNSSNQTKVMRKETEMKLDLLRSELAKFESLLVCYSGGTDSTLLLAVAKEQLKDKAEAVIFQTAAIPQRLFTEALKQAIDIGVHPHIVDFDILGNPSLAANPEDRCYICKQNMLALALELADKRGIKAVAEGSQADDLKRHRPGRKAVAEANVFSPLEQVDLNKQEIREISRIMKLRNWANSSYSCLMTKFPFGERITIEKLRKIAEAEEFLRDLDFKNFTVKDHGDLVRLGLGLNETVAALGQYREIIVRYFRTLGYEHIAADIEESEGSTPSKGEILL